MSDRRHPWPVVLGERGDLALAAAFLAGALAEQFAHGDTEHSPWAVLAVAALTATVVVRRTHPVAATGAGALLVLVLPHTHGNFPPAVFQYVWPIVMAYSCGAHGPARAGLVATVALAGAIQVHIGFADAPNLEIAIATLPPWWAGLEVRRRRELVRQLAERTHELEAEEEAFVRLSVERERARIARDLHDIVSHHLAVMVIQAGAGRLAEPYEEPVADRRFADIRDAGAQALAEVDRLVKVLDTDTAAVPRLARLLDRARAAGVRVVVTPPRPALAPDVEAVAYRVTQEALTNAMKHAPGVPVDIEVALAGGQLTITARNDLAAEPSTIAHTGSGLGLAGMSERLAALGGTLAAGPDSDGGFRVCARLPAAVREA